MPTLTGRALCRLSLAQPQGPGAQVGDCPACARPQPRRGLGPACSVPTSSAPGPLATPRGTRPCTCSLGSTSPWRPLPGLGMELPQTHFSHPHFEPPEKNFQPQLLTGAPAKTNPGNPLTPQPGAVTVWTPGSSGVPGGASSSSERWHCCGPRLRKLGAHSARSRPLESRGSPPGALITGHAPGARRVRI